jgi:hypothetical protein
MVAFSSGSEVPADFVDQHDGFAIVIVTGNHASNVQGHWGAFPLKKSEDISCIACAREAQNIQAHTR